MFVQSVQDNLRICILFQFDYDTHTASAGRFISDISDTFNRLCSYSIHTHQADINNGFITVKGGHRIGICGTVVVRDNKVYNIKNISSVNIRIACEIKGCSDFIDFSVKNLLVISPPCCGKTTLIRDLCRKKIGIQKF